jgi:flagellar assembly protein FliH
MRTSSLTETLAESVTGSYLPYHYVDVRGPAQADPIRASFEVSATCSVPPMLLDAAKAEATAAGFAAGWAQGMREASTQMAEDIRLARLREQKHHTSRRTALRSAIAAMDQAVAALEGSAVPAAEQLEQTLLTLGTTLAESLLQRELDRSGTLAQDALARVLRLAPAGEAIQVRLCPADYEVLLADDELPELANRKIELIADPTLSPGDALATSGVTDIDARLSAGMERIKAVLSA